MKKTRIFQIIFFVIIISGCTTNNTKSKLVGLWSVDIDDEIIRQNQWDNILGNVIILKSDFSCKGIVFFDPKTKERLNSEGTWSIIHFNNTDSIEFIIPGNSMSGKYKLDFYRDYTNKLLKIKLSNSNISFTCSKFLQNFDRIYNW